LKLLFNEDDEETDNNTQKDILFAAENIDKKSNNLTEKLNNLFEIEKEKKENDDNNKLFSIKNKEEKKNHSKDNKNSQKNLGLLVFNEEEENDDLKFKKNLSTSKNNCNTNVNKENNESNEKNLQTANSNKNEVTNVFEDIFFNIPEKIINQNLLKNGDAHSLENIKASPLFGEIKITERKDNLFDFEAADTNEKGKEETNKIENKNLNILNKDLFDFFSNSAANKDNEELNKSKLNSKKNLQFLLNTEDEIKETIQKEISSKESKIDVLSDIQKTENKNSENEVKPQGARLSEINASEPEKKSILDYNEKNNIQIDKNYNFVSDDTGEKDELVIDNKIKEVNLITSSEKPISESNPADKKDIENSLSTTLKSNQEEVTEYQDNTKRIRRITNTMINADILPGLDDYNDNSSAVKAKLNFDEIVNENNIDKEAKKTDKIKKQAINFADPLKPRKNKPNKEYVKKVTEKPKESNQIKPKNQIYSVFEDSEEEKLPSNTNENVLINSKVIIKEEKVLDETTVNNPEIQNKPQKIDEKEIANEKIKESQQAKPEIKAEERRKSIKVNKFSEIQKVYFFKVFFV